MLVKGATADDNVLKSLYLKTQLDKRLGRTSHIAPGDLAAIFHLIY